MDQEIFHDLFNGKKITFMASTISTISDVHELTIFTKGQLKPTLVGQIEWCILKKKKIREKEMYVLNIQNGSLLFYHENARKNFIQNRIDIELIDENFKYDILIATNNLNNQPKYDFVSIMFFDEFLSEKNKVLKNGNEELFKELISMYESSDRNILSALIEKITGITDLTIIDSTLFDYYKIK